MNCKTRKLGMKNQQCNKKLSKTGCKLYNRIFSYNNYVLLNKPNLKKESVFSWLLSVKRIEFIRNY